MKTIETLKEIFDLAIGSKKMVQKLIKTTNNKKENGYGAKTGISGYGTKTGISGDKAKTGISGYGAQTGISGDWAQTGISGDSAKTGISGYEARTGISGDEAKTGISGYGAQTGISGDWAKTGISGHGAQTGISGNWAKTGISGDKAKTGISGHGAQTGISGDWAKTGISGHGAQTGISGDWAQTGISGDSAKTGISGDKARTEITGQKSVIASIGFNNIVKAIQGTWITLAEYRKNKNDIWEVFYVKTEKVDGKNIKENTFYGLYNKEFREYKEFDNIGCLILQKKQNVYKIFNFSSNEIGYVLENDEQYAHGKTIKECRDSLIYKLSNRDKSEYEKWDLDKKITKKEAIQSYRVITGACEYGVKSFCESKKIPQKITPQKIIELTEGQFGNEVYKDFFNRG